MHPHPLTAAPCSQNLQTERQKSAASTHPPSIPHHYCWAVVNSHNLSAYAPGSVLVFLVTSQNVSLSFLHFSTLSFLLSVFPSLSLQHTHWKRHSCSTNCCILHFPLRHSPPPPACIHRNSEVSLMLTACIITHMNLTSLRV